MQLSLDVVFLAKVRMDTRSLREEFQSKVKITPNEITVGQFRAVKADRSELGDSRYRIFEREKCDFWLIHDGKQHKLGKDDNILIPEDKITDVVDAYFNQKQMIRGLGIPFVTVKGEEGEISVVNRLLFLESLNGKSPEEVAKIVRENINRAFIADLF